MGYSPGACSNSSLRSRSWDRERVMPLMPSASRFLVGCDDRIRACFDRDYPTVHRQALMKKQPPRADPKLKKELEDIKNLLDKAEQDALSVQSAVVETQGQVEARLG